jgi:hypothetical protein
VKDLKSCTRRIRIELEMKTARKKADKLRLGEIMEAGDKDSDNEDNDNSITQSLEKEMPNK